MWLSSLCLVNLLKLNLTVISIRDPSTSYGSPVDKYVSSSAKSGSASLTNLNDF